HCAAHGAPAVLAGRGTPQESTASGRVAGQSAGPPPNPRPLPAHRAARRRHVRDRRIWSTTWSSPTSLEAASSVFTASTKVESSPDRLSLDSTQTAATLEGGWRK